MSPSDHLHHDGPDQGDAHPERADASGWYRDEAAVLTELKRSRADEAPPPSVRGYGGIREVQRGGQGVIYHAVQLSTNRPVAIKVLLDRYGAMPPVRRRFEREIDLIASLRHPNIVRVYDSGVTEDGRLYLIMDYIDGVPLDEFVAVRRVATRSNDGRMMAVDDVVSLFITISRTISFAHQRGIIHRDLKPGNIRIDQAGEPIILDFGLAKVVDTTGDGAVSGSLSVSGQILGSLPWASPEQADGRSREADVRSDIYSIGVMLYQALTGRMPYDTDSGMRQTLMNILDTVPPRPGSHRAGIDHDLDTIVLKALAKEPSRRYQSAEALAEDLARYRVGEPIEARRDSTWYVVRKTAQRHRAAVIAVLGGVTALMVFMIVLGVLYQRAVQSEQLAAERLVLMEREADRAERERARAERRFGEVRALANQLIFDVHDAIEPLAGSREVRETIVRTALEYLSSLADESGDDEALQLEIAAAYRRIGNIQGNPFTANLGDTTGALESYETALAIQRTVLDRRGDDPELQREVADLISFTGDMHQWMGRRERAFELYAEARAMLEPVRAADPANRNIRRLIAAIHVKRGDTLQWLDDSEAMLHEFQAALEVLADLAEEPDGPRDLMNLAAAHTKVGFALGYKLSRHEEALEHHRRSLEINQSVVDTDPENAHALRAASISANQVGATLVALERFDEAAVTYDRSLAIAQQLYDADSGNALAASDLAFTHNKIGELFLATSEPRRAIEHFLAALDVRRRIAERDPENANFQRDLATSHSLVARAHEAIGTEDGEREDRAQQLQRAVHHFGRAGDIMQQLRDRGTLGEVDADRPEFFAAEAKRIQAVIEN